MWRVSSCQLVRGAPERYTGLAGLQLSAAIISIHPTDDAGIAWLQHIMILIV
jgi:hypothetical protein